MVARRSNEFGIDEHPFFRAMVQNDPPITHSAPMGSRLHAWLFATYSASPCCQQGKREAVVRCKTSAWQYLSNDEYQIRARSDS